MWFAYMIGEWTEGTVITPMKVVQARLRESLRPAYETQKLEENLPLSPALHLLLKRYVTVLNGSAFCIDLAEADAEEHDVDVRKLHTVAQTARGGRVRGQRPVFGSRTGGPLRPQARSKFR